MTTHDIAALREIMWSVAQGVREAISEDSGPREESIALPFAVEKLVNKATDDAVALLALPALLDRLERAERDAKRYRWIREQVGYYQDGSQQTVSLFVDDATRSEFIFVGKVTHGTDGSTFEGIIDTALTPTPEQP